MKMIAVQLMSLAIIIVAFTAFVFGQDRSIPVDEFDKMLSTAEAKLLTVKRKVIDSHIEPGGSGIGNGSIRIVTTLTIDDMAGGVRVAHNRVGAETSTDDEIRIGNLVYSRENKGKWMKGPLLPTIGIVPTEESMNEVDFRSISGACQVEVIGSGMDEVRVYVKNEFHTYRTKDWPYKTVTTRIWVRKDGMLAKKVEEANLLNTGRSHRNETTYEYGPNIKVVAPKLKEALVSQLR